MRYRSQLGRPNLVSETSGQKFREFRSAHEVVLIGGARNMPLSVSAQAVRVTASAEPIDRATRRFPSGSLVLVVGKLRQ